MISPEDFALIDRFIRNELSGPELDRFLDRYRSDSAFKREVILQKDIAFSLIYHERHQMRERVDKIADEIVNSKSYNAYGASVFKRNPALKFILGGAAAVIVIAVAYVIFLVPHDGRSGNNTSTPAAATINNDEPGTGAETEATTSTETVIAEEEEEKIPRLSFAVPEDSIKGPFDLMEDEEKEVPAPSPTVNSGTNTKKDDSQSFNVWTYVPKDMSTFSVQKVDSNANGYYKYRVRADGKTGYVWHADKDLERKLYNQMRDRR